jgi:hypothetical protein
MAKQTINVGLTANDKKGDSLRTAFQKVNANFTELYTTTGLDAAANQLVNGTHVVDLGSTGILTFPDGLTLVDSVLEKRLEETTTDGIDTFTNIVGSKLTLTNSTISMEAYVDPAGANNTSVGRVTATTSAVLIEALSDIVGGTAGGSLLLTDSGLQLNTTDGVSNQTFSIGEGSITFPSGPRLRGQNETICPVSVDTVIYTSYNNVSAIKLFVMVEGVVDGGGSEVEMQACDIIAVKGQNDNLVHITAYGITYSGTSAFAEFDGRWNSISQKMEITCRPISTTNNVYVNAHAVEFSSNF